MFQRNSQRGAVIPLVAVLLLVIIVCVALVVDLGHVHNVKVELQRAVDAAALAGARQLPNCGNVDLVAGSVLGENTVDTKLIREMTGAEIQTSIEVGRWDTNESAFGQSAGNRWTDREDYCTNPVGDIPNAVYVRAERNVEHAFFFFGIGTTQVVADAIALAEPINPVLPLLMMSCIPLDSLTGNFGALPETVSGLKYFFFNVSPEDTAAWTTLTLPGGADTIRDILEDRTQRNLFEQIVFGHNLPNDGIENTEPRPGTLAAPPVGCDHPMGTNINCGLGMINSKELAPPEDFTGPTGNPAFPSPAQPISIGSNAPYDLDHFDPLFGYAENHALPRWYNFNDSDSVLKTDDHFLRVFTQDGILLKNASESFSTYQSRLQSYYDGVVRPFNDERFMSGDAGGSDFVIGPDTGPPYDLKQGMRQIIATKYGVNANDVDYWPNFLKLMIHAGYPRVGMTNGTTASLLDAFFSLPEIVNETPTGATLQCADNKPLDSTTDPAYGGQTLRVQSPVVFTGICELLPAMNLAGDDFVYVGLADFLITRAWKGQPNPYACPGPDYVNVMCPDCPNPFYPPDSGGMNFPPIPSGGELTAASDSIHGLEGLMKVPQIGSAEAAATVKTYLVE